MGRGRNGILCEGKNFEKRGLRGDKERYVFFSKAPHKTKKEPLVLPSSFIESLKVMDPQAVAALLLRS